LNGSTADRQRRRNARSPDAVTRTDRGFILVSVLWLLVLLTLVTMVLLTAVRVDVRAAGQFVRHAELKCWLTA
jgi:Tfp pilus assembly protein PilX